ncbi:MAG: hypothetical protein CMA65_03270 [Euryarchaeota archaeon]|jgi:hypothetical protein|nr:hypothetical protein [Euryarchaeota archaeon]MBQ70494.1 hypothetical protein [Euryarchaeota archaeon]|tara:strand:- start:24896 stop:25201 length:306 start_codon:yes stop_codon:yes gene_type:complete
MRTCIDLLLALPHIDAPRMKGEVNYLAGRLEQLRVQRSITNEAYLDAGAVQGAIEMIANMVDMGVPQIEVQDQLRQQLHRAQRLETKHPGLNWAVESGRAS